MTNLPAVTGQFSQDTLDAMRRFLEAGDGAENTKGAYANAWKHFELYCREHGADALPAAPHIVCAYFTELADRGYKASSLTVYASAISKAHAGTPGANPIESVEYRQLMKGIRRTLGTAKKPKAPIELDALKQIVSTIPDDLRGRRDRAILLLGWGGAFRRSELTSLDVEDIRVNGKEAVITLRRSKTDQEGRGLVKHVPILQDKSICPVTALRAWMDAAGIHSGIVFRSIDRWGHVHNNRMEGREVARIVKARCDTAGLDPRQYAGHSLRRGFVTEAARAGAQAWQIMKQTGHKSERILYGYIDEVSNGAVDATRLAFGE